LNRWFAERDHTIAFLIHVAHHSPDGATLARRVPSVKEDDRLFVGPFDVLLELDQLGLVRLEELRPKVLGEGCIEHLFAVLLLDALMDRLNLVDNRQVIAKGFYLLDNGADSRGGPLH